MTNPECEAPAREVAAVVLAAGRSARMHSDIPKALHRLAGRPLLAYLGAALDELAPSRTVVVTAPNRDDVAATLPGATHAVQDEPLGTAHAVECALDALEGSDSDVLAVFADSPLLTAATMRSMLARRAAEDEPAVVVMGFEPEDPSGYGRLVQSGDDEVEAIVEHAKASDAQRALRLCNSGIMLVDGSIVRDLLRGVLGDGAGGERYLTDIVRIARLRGRRCAVVQGARHEAMGVNTRGDLAVAEAIVQRGLRAAALAGGVTLTDPGTVYLSADTAFGRDVVVEPSVFFGPGVRVGNGATIRAFCHLEGVEIGDGASVGPFARLRPGTSLAAGARIGNFVEAKNAALGPGAKANHLTYLGDTAVGAGANIGAGTITCNYDGVAKSRTDIGDGAFIGSNTALVAPVRVGAGAVVGAGSTITRDVGDGALALTRPPQRDTPGWSARRRAARVSQKGG